MTRRSTSGSERRRQFGKRPGVRVPGRRLQAGYRDTPVSKYDAELINDLMTAGLRPTAVLINPPFSRSIGRHADPVAVFRHLRAALMRLAPGGRCAAVLHLDAERLVPVLS